jgi:hypothetical protein
MSFNSSESSSNFQPKHNHNHNHNHNHKHKHEHEHEHEHEHKHRCPHKCNKNPCPHPPKPQPKPCPPPQPKPCPPKPQPQPKPCPPKPKPQPQPQPCSSSSSSSSSSPSPCPPKFKCDENHIKKFYDAFKTLKNVDEFTRKTGAVAAIYHHIENDFVSISTTLPDEDGSPSLHTRIDRSSPAYAALINNKAFTGKATLFGKKYCVKYAPYYTDDCHGVVIALFIGIPLY